MGRDLIVSLTFAEETRSHQIYTQRVEEEFTHNTFFLCFIFFLKINL